MNANNFKSSIPTSTVENYNRCEIIVMIRGNNVKKSTRNQTSTNSKSSYLIAFKPVWDIQLKQFKRFFYFLKRLDQGSFSAKLR